MTDEQEPTDVSDIESDIKSNSDTESTATKVQKIVFSLPVDHTGTTVYVKGWRQETNQNPPIVIIHDLGENISMYRDVAANLVESGNNVYGFDLRGHGRSGRRLGHAPDFATFTRDLLQVAAWVKHQERGQTPIIMGQGIGALIALSFAQKHPNFCLAVILNAPILELRHEPSVFSLTTIKLMTEIFPQMRIPKVLSPSFSVDSRKQMPKSVQNLATRFTPRLSYSFTTEILNAIKNTEKHFTNYNGLILILCPEQDEVCSFRELKKLAALHNQHNLMLIDLPDSPHCVFTEDAKIALRNLGHVKSWLHNLTEKMKVLSAAEGKVAENSEESEAGETSESKDNRSGASIKSTSPAKSEAKNDEL